MGNCHSRGTPKPKQKEALPIDSTFILPSLLTRWPLGGGFATGTIDLGGIQVCQISSFTKVWATYEGGPGNSGATFLDPSSIPGGFYIGSYAQPNNNLLFGRVLAAKDDTNGAILQQPTDYKLVYGGASV